MDAESQVPLVVFSNLDAVLHDRDGRGHEAVRPAITLLTAARIPLVIASSRTRAEIEVLQEKLGIRHPFIAENGGAVYVPVGYFPDVLPHATSRYGYQVIDGGVPYRDVVSTLHRLAKQLNVGIESFSQMSVEEVGRAYDLSLLEARLAKLRDHTEPFRFTDATPKARKRLFHALQSAGFAFVDDGRFWHVRARTDLPGWMRTLRACYSSGHRVSAAGLSDRVEDLPLLQEVDVPVVVQGAAGRSSAELYRALPQAVLTTASGAAGWIEGVTKLVQRIPGIGQRVAA